MFIVQHKCSIIKSGLLKCKVTFIKYYIYISSKSIKYIIEWLSGLLILILRSKYSLLDHVKKCLAIFIKVVQFKLHFT